MNVAVKHEFIIYDTEYWTDEGVMARNWAGLNDHPPLLMQIGALKVSVEKGLPVREEFTLLVKPKDAFGNNVLVTPYFTKLTNITAEQVEKGGVLMDEAMTRFYEFTGERLMYSYGGDMRDCIVPSCFIQSVSCPFSARQERDVRHVLHRAGMSEEEMRQNTSGTLAAHFGIDIPGHWTHDALCDAGSILVTLRHLIEKGRLNPAWLTEEVGARDEGNI